MNPLRANVTLSLPRLSIQNSTPVSPWKSGNAVLGRFGLAGPSRPFRTFWTLTLGLCLGPLRLPFPCRVLVSVTQVSLLSLACVVSEARACVRSQPFCVPVSCHMRGPRLGPSSSDRLCSWPRWHLLRTWSHTGSSPSCSRLRDSWRRILLWSRLSPSRVCSPDPARALPCPRLLLVVLVVLLSQRGPTLSIKGPRGSSRPLGFHAPPLWLPGLRC